MRVTGPTVRRRNHAWLQMRSLERQRRAAGNADSSGNEPASSVNSSGNDSNSDSDSAPTKARTQTRTATSRPPLASVTIGLKTKRSPALTYTARGRVSARATAAPGEKEEDSDSESDGAESGSDSEDSDNESTTRSTKTTSSSVTAPPPPATITSAGTTATIAPSPPPAVSVSNTNSAAQPTVTSASRASSQTAPITTLTPIAHPPKPAAPSSSTSKSSSLDQLATSLTKSAPTGKSTTSLAPVASTTKAPLPPVPATGSAQNGDGQFGQPERDMDGSKTDVPTVVPAPRNKMNGGAVAGVVIGVLAFVALLVGAAIIWRRRRRSRGLPFFPQTRFRLGSNRDDGPPHPASIGGPLPGKVGGAAPVKTNTQIMDDLLRGAYLADNGSNDMEHSSWPAAEKFRQADSTPQLPPQQQQMSAFMDEKAYTALAGPPTPGYPRKPVLRWLSEVKTPVQPNGPQMPPGSPEVPPSATFPTGLPAPGGVAGKGRVPDPPRPAYFGRDTMTTNTTNTSVRWFG